MDLYNYCFLLTYRLDQQKKLKCAFQNDKPHEKVHKLWSGLNKKIQKGLWHEKLKPEISSYEEVSHAAELIEIIENVDIGPDLGSNNKKKDKGTSHSSSNNNDGSGLSHHKAHNDKGSSSQNSGNNGTSFSNHGNSSSDKGGRSDYRKSNNCQNHQHKRNQCQELTDKKKDKYHAVGKCFQCGKIGHMSCQCPQGKTMSRNGNVPPGISSIEPILDPEELRQLANTTEEITELSLSTMAWDTLSKTSETEWESDVIEEYSDPENSSDNYQTSSPMPSLATISNSGISDDNKSDSGEYENCKSGESESDKKSVALNDIELADIFQYCDYEFIPRETRCEICPEWLHNEMNHEDYGDSAHLRYPGLGRFSVFQVSDTMYCIKDHEYKDTMNGSEEFPQWMYLGVEHLENPAFCIESIEKCLDIGGLYSDNCFFELEPGSCWFIVTWAGKETYCIWDQFRDAHLDLSSKLLKIHWFDLDMSERPLLSLLFGHEDNSNEVALEVNGDFVSSTFADQLKLKLIDLAKPLPLQLATQGSRSKISSRVKVQFEYQNISKHCYFDIVNLSSYDLILSTLWLFQHKVTIGFHDSKVIISSSQALPIEGTNVSQLSLRAMDLLDERIEAACQELTWCPEMF
ncbi:hypothetical protein L218DRAFT_1021588 [Marasmius fiardii PR-910]|nr:hypothetical protein L218DRAFT_1021588 [Marasmius fiardii PR-910]